MLEKTNKFMDLIKKQIKKDEIKYEEEQEVN